MVQASSTQEAVCSSCGFETRKAGSRSPSLAPKTQNRVAGRNHSQVCLACLKAPVRRRDYVICHSCFKKHGAALRALEHEPPNLVEVQRKIWEQRSPANRVPAIRAWIAYAAYLLAQEGDDECLIMARRELPALAMNSQGEGERESIPTFQRNISALEETLGPSQAVPSDRPGAYRTKDGHWVRSKSEREIANFLFDRRIPYIYEKRIHLDGRDLRPDFFLPDVAGGLFLEHFGLDTAEYLANANDRVLRFRKAGLRLVATSEKEAGDMETALQRKLQPFIPSLRDGGKS